MLIPKFCMDLIAVSLPEPGPHTLTSSCLIPWSRAFLTAVSVAIWAANGVPFFDPLNPQEPDEDHDITFPFKSVTDTIEKNTKSL